MTYNFLLYTIVSGVMTLYDIFINNCNVLGEAFV